MTLEDLSDSEKLTLIKMVDLIIHRMMHPITGGHPSPENTKIWITQGIITAYLSGKDGDLEQNIHNLDEPSRN